MCVADTWVTIFGSGTYDSIMCSLVINILAHLKILQKRFENLGSYNMDSLKGLLEYHRKVREYFLVFQELNSLVIFWQFIYMTITVCFNRFVVVMVRTTEVCRIFTFYSICFQSDNWSIKFQCAVYAGSVCFQAFLYDFLGTQVHAEVQISNKLPLKHNFHNIFQSKAICNSIYSCGWFNLPIKSKKDVLLVMAMLQKPFVLKSFIYTKNLESFTDVCEIINLIDSKS